MFGFDIVVTETTAVELEVDPAVADTYYSDSEEEYGPETTRTFHEDKDTKYKLPIDKFEQDRLDLQHQMLKVMMDERIYLPPLNPEEVKHVLDVGTGHGIWAVEFATEYPNTQVIGTDLSPSKRESTPENCKFIVADAEETWDFPHKFDFVHMRDLMMCFSDQKEVFRSAYNALEPGGYFQILDAKLPPAAIDDSMESSGIAKWFQACVEAGEAGSRPWTNIPKYMEWLEDIGFEEVTETIYHNPINDWAMGAKEKKIGAMMQKDIKRWLYSTTRTVVEGSNMDEAEVKELLLNAKKSGRDRNIHAYIPIYVVWGRKPFPSET
ncbi:uncharacterized protein EAF02_005909 [Botrytis sinoallii]|uniref:uncharacterized protein n=1 Tax=Botrytis sinoallii TaxID=1463999 RepID=UPI0019021A27|nr:uncharacterized protein EAF02_005909 [Botrytis sinoallii]KAF7882546.1 hypothetical protein EAF02_005909 [Botrytis sinoallii]